MVRSCEKDARRTNTKEGDGMVAAREVKERETYYHLDTRNNNNNEGKKIGGRTI